MAMIFLLFPEDGAEMPKINSAWSLSETKAPPSVPPFLFPTSRTIPTFGYQENLLFYLMCAEYNYILIKCLKIDVFVHLFPFPFFILSYFLSIFLAFFLALFLAFLLPFFFLFLCLFFFFSSLPFRKRAMSQTNQSGSIKAREREITRYFIGRCSSSSPMSTGTLANAQMRTNF